MAQLQDKVAIVTGAGQGIGRATAELFSREGATVVVNDIVHERVKEVVALLGSRGGKTMLSDASYEDETAVRATVEAAAHTFGHVDILVNNIGGNAGIPFRIFTENSRTFGR